MPQSIFVQVGQCGNQIAYNFWELALQEYLLHQTNVEDNDNFFKICRSSRSSASDISIKMKARTIMVDMEESVVSRILKGPLKDLFERRQLVTDVSGSGNNWAVGNKFYGSKYRDELKNLVRKEVEECSNLQCFFLIHSLGGGTGSGLGTAIVEYLCDDYPKIPKFVFAAFPSYQDDVITSPYNAMLANSKLINFADCVIPFDNKALTEICNKFSKMKMLQTCNIFSKSKTKNYLNEEEAGSFSEMNELVANSILNLTSSSRFPGSLNTDINEIIMNMIPYPRLHYLVSSVSPLFYYREIRQKLDEMFNEAFSGAHQLFQCPLREGVLLGSALLCRGQVSMSDISHNIDRLKSCRKFVPWNEEGWKIGLCDVPHIHSHYSLLMLSNSSSIAKPFTLLRDNFLKMYRKKAHLHHFLEVESMDNDCFKSSLNDLEELIKDYRSVEKVSQFSIPPRLKILS